MPIREQPDTYVNEHEILFLWNALYLHVYPAVRLANVQVLTYVLAAKFYI